jgi:hypothetical protein
MRGTNVDDWKSAQRRALNEKVNRAANAIDRASEVLWTDFVTTFDGAFTDTTKKQKAMSDLLQLKMYRGDLDTYISRFKHYAEQAGYDLDSNATVDIFSRGLNDALANACMNRDTQPVTMTDWINAAQTEQRKYANKTVFQRSQQNQWTIPAGWNRNTKSNRGQTQQSHQSQRRHPNDQTVPMDIDGFAARKVTTEEEKQ